MGEEVERGEAMQFQEVRWGGVVGGGLLALALAVKRRSAGDAAGSAEPGATVWDKMEQAMTGMPETFPPRIMFDNIAAIRQDTTRIVEMLEPRPTQPLEEADDAS
jgi:hypothetical protein